MNNNQIQIAIEQSITNQINKINTAIAGTILSYASGRATVQPQGTKQYEDGRTLSYPTIYNVPIIFPTGDGGNAGITFPIKAGDGCLLIFSQDNMQTFLSKTKTDDQRHFQLSDAICIPGMYTDKFAAMETNADDVTLSNSGSKVTLGSGGFNGTLSDGTTFAFSGSDLVVNGISLTKHKHGGVTSGSDKTDVPE
ncbi:Gp138 family membrane-puncturing spike protein [Pectinatus frisingensis]|uniref:Gp138 family membrane-puncturing spike protein n=1 Tax=Pectinatus frisingensis TaxID=865 RepID=UPI0018C4536E|nr:Gp138 family membrane-puncturing spike protein [Pectinatus frisingensis]